MRVVTNERKVKSRQAISKYASIAGFVFLLGGLAISLRTNYLQWAYLSTFAGFGLATLGAYHVERWSRDPIAHEAIRKAFKGLDNRHHLYNYVLPTPHVMLTPRGLVVLRPQRQDGHIICIDGKWKQDFKWSHIFQGMARESLGNPSAELRRDIERVKSWVGKQLPDYADEIDVEGIVVFLNRNLNLEVRGADVPVVRTKELKRTLRGDVSKKMRPINKTIQAAIDKAAGG